MEAVLFWLDLQTRGWRKERESKMLTLGELLDELRTFNPLLPVVYEDHKSPGDPHSYRGYYQDLSFQDREDGTASTSEFIKVLENCIGKTFEGWKGGEFTMDRTTPLWRAYEGDCGVAMVSVEATNQAAVIKTSSEDA